MLQVFLYIDINGANDANDALFHPKPERNDPKYAKRRKIDFTMTECPCFFCEYQKWSDETPGLHRQYYVTYDKTCIIARSNSEITNCNTLIDETMNDET